MNTNNSSPFPSDILAKLIEDLNEVTDMWRNAPRHFKGAALTNFHDRMVTPELEKLQEKLPGFDVLWSQEYRKFGFFTSIQDTTAMEEGNQ